MQWVNACGSPDQKGHEQLLLAAWGDPKDYLRVTALSEIVATSFSWLLFKFKWKMNFHSCPCRSGALKHSRVLGVWVPMGHWGRLRGRTPILFLLSGVLPGSLLESELHVVKSLLPAQLEEKPDAQRVFIPSKANYVHCKTLCSIFNRNLSEIHHILHWAEWNTFFLGDWGPLCESRYFFGP